MFQWKYVFHLWKSSSTQGKRQNQIWKKGTFSKQGYSLKTKRKPQKNHMNFMWKTWNFFPVVGGADVSSSLGTAKRFRPGKKGEKSSLF